MRSYRFTPYGGSAIASRNSDRKSPMSLAHKIIKRLMITTLVGTGVAYGWLYLKAARVQNYLEQRALVQQAREISDFIAIGKDGAVTLDLPPRLSGADTSARRSYPSSWRDEAGRIVA